MSSVSYQLIQDKPYVINLIEDTIDISNEIPAFNSYI